jgi:hypothetical protein
MDSKSKVLTGLLERRALEADFQRLTTLTDPEQQAEHAARIAGRGQAALTVLTSMLDTEDPQLRGGLGQVAVLLPREQVVPALRAVAKTGERSAQITALILLERYLGEPPDDSTVAALGDPENIALQSLRELVQAMDADPSSIIEYLVQLGQQPPDVPYMILRAVPKAGSSPHLITLLRMFAQDPDQTLAREALDQLGRMRSAAAARALASLAATLPPPQAVLAERCNRKAMMSGSARQEPELCAPFDAPDHEWRVLLSALDGSGSQTVMFIGIKEYDAESRIVFSVIVDEDDGIQSAYGSLAAPMTYPSANAKLPAVYAIQKGDTLTWFAETSLRVGRQALRESLALNWGRRSPSPLEYRLFNSLVWLAEDATSAAAEADAEPDAGPKAQRPVRDAQSEAPGAIAISGLLDHPAFADWRWPIGEAFLSEVCAVVQEQPGASGSCRSELITRIAQTEFGAQAKERYARRLQKMRGWLILAGAPDAAAAADAASSEFQQNPAEESLFVRRLIGRSIDAVEDVVARPG